MTVTYGVSMGPDARPERWRDERRWIRKGPGTPFRKLQTVGFLVRRDRAAVLAFLRAPYPVPIALRERIALVRALMRATNAVRGYHTLTEILTVADRILRLAGRPGLRVIEAGAGSGASTAKLSLVTKLAGGRLEVFDTFQGIPDNDERHELLDGRALRFSKGAFRGRLGAVRRRVAAHGAIDVCTFHKGAFEDTLPRFMGHVDVALLDVDLVASTRTCLRHLLPRMRPGGSLLSQDGHLRATHDLLADRAFWQDVVERAPPYVHGLGHAKLLEIEAPFREPRARDQGANRSRPVAPAR